MSGSKVRKLKGARRTSMTCVAFCCANEGDDHRLVTGSANGTATLWNWTEGRTCHIFSGFHRHGINSVSCSVMNVLACACSDANVSLWCLRKLVCSKISAPVSYRACQRSCDDFFTWLSFLQTLLRVVRHEDSVSGVQFANSGSRIVTSDMGGKVHVADVESGHVLLSFDGHHDRVVSVSVDRIGMFAASASADGSARFFFSRCRRTWLPC